MRGYKGGRARPCARMGAEAVAPNAGTGTCPPTLSRRNRRTKVG